MKGCRDKGTEGSRERGGNVVTLPYGRVSVRGRGWVRDSSGGAVVPEGQRDDSPAIDRWETEVRGEMSPVGTDEWAFGCSTIPTGLSAHNAATFPALKRWAILTGPSGASERLATPEVIAVPNSIGSGCFMLTFGPMIVTPTPRHEVA